MAKPTDRSLLSLSDTELRAELAVTAAHVTYNYNDLVAELDRRSRNRQARASFVLSAVGIVIAVVALIVTALKS
jgi:multidrug efflux pump subunit AcrA (membrane-fusion protein)